MCLSVPNGPKTFHLSPMPCLRVVLPWGCRLRGARDPAGAHVLPPAHAIQPGSLAATSETLRLIPAEPGCSPVAGCWRMFLSAGGIGTTAPLDSIRMHPAGARDMWQAALGSRASASNTAVRCWAPRAGKCLDVCPSPATKAHRSHPMEPQRSCELQG